MDDEHILAFVEAVHRTYFDAVHVLALYAVVRDDIGHVSGRSCSYVDALGLAFWAGIWAGIREEPDQKR
jgi:hypothetical protein